MEEGHFPSSFQLLQMSHRTFQINLEVNFNSMHVSLYSPLIIIFKGSSSFSCVLLKSLRMNQEEESRSSRWSQKHAARQNQEEDFLVHQGSCD